MTQSTEVSPSFQYFLDNESVILNLQNILSVAMSKVIRIFCFNFQFLIFLRLPFPKKLTDGSVHNLLFIEILCGRGNEYVRAAW